MWPEHRETVRAWAAVCDQWRLGPHGIVLGLDWPAAAVLLQALGTPLDAGVLAGLRKMERAALSVMDEARLAQQGKK